MAKVSSDGIPDEMKERIRDVSKWVRDLTDNWYIVKREIVSELRPSDRTLFTNSRRRKDKDLNHLEQCIMVFWRELTGVQLLLLSDK